MLGTGDGGVARALGLAGVQAALALTGIALIGRFALGPVLHAVARTRSAELFVAAALLLVLGAGLATAAAGLSMALGGFLAGMLLADSEFRHQVDADIKPFRGLLLGLFFMTVGMTVDPAVVMAEAGPILTLVAALAVAKGGIIALLVRGFGLSTVEALRTGLVLGHAGEFAFVIVTLAPQVGVVAAADVQTLIVAAALSMALCPLLDRVGEAWARRRDREAVEVDAIAEETRDLKGHVIVAGFGRVGRLVARMLNETRTSWIAVDLDARRVAGWRRNGLAVYFGDATRIGILRAAGAARAGAVVITLDDEEQAEAAVHAVRQTWPDLATIARRGARDDGGGPAPWLPCARRAGRRGGPDRHRRGRRARRSWAAPRALSGSLRSSVALWVSPWRVCSLGQPW